MQQLMILQKGDSSLRTEAAASPADAADAAVDAQQWEAKVSSAAAT